jgi:hypothetical protein
MRTLAFGIAISAIFTGCAVHTYVPPTPAFESGVSSLTRTVNASYDQAWRAIEQFAKDRYEITVANKSRGQIQLSLPAAPAPSEFISCGVNQTTGGMFDTTTEFLYQLSKDTTVNLDVLQRAQLAREGSDQVKVEVNGLYVLRVGYQLNPMNGALQGGEIYRFESTGSVVVTNPATGQVGTCQSAGIAEQAILNAAGGNP